MSSRIYERTSFGPRPMCSTSNLTIASLISASISPFVFIDGRNTLAVGSVARLSKQVIYLGFAKTCELLFAFDEERTLQQVRLLEHELDRLIFGRRLLLHVSFFV